MRKLVLASTSLSRKLLLQRLFTSFETVAPNIDETPLFNESCHELVLRLSQLKARKIINEYPDALIIGADQVASFDNHIIGKPLTLEHAKMQLQSMSGKRITYYIGMCLFDSKNQTQQSVVEKFDVVFRKMSNVVIDTYLNKEQPLDCAGSLKVDGLGITLVDSFDGGDFTGLIGLPLIQLTNMLINVGFDLYGKK